MKKFCLVALPLLLLTASALAQNAPARGRFDGLKSSITVMVEGLNCTTSVGSAAFSALSWSFGAIQPVQSGGTGGGTSAGKASLSDLSISKRTDACSPALFAAAVSGKHFQKVTVVQQDVQKDDTFKVTLEQVLVSSYQLGGTQSQEVPTEQVSFSFAKICFEDSQSGAKACYNLATGALN
jgi:type VI secretion system Hcp family effector